MDEQGIEVVLIHGFAGGPSMWDEVASSSLEQGLRFHRIWLPGHGGQPVASGMSFADVVREIAGRFERPCHLVAYSMGARIALAWAMAEPQQVASMSLIGVNPGLECADERGARVVWDEEQARRIEQLGVEGFIDEWEALPLFATQRRNATKGSLERQRQMRLAHDANGLAWAMRRLGLGHMPSQWEAMKSSPVPLHLIVGEEDLKFRGIADRVAERVSGARCHVVRGAGHNVVLESPAAVREVITTVLGC